MQPYYRVHNNIRVLNLYGEDSNEPMKIHLDPRVEHPLDIVFVMPNDTVKVVIQTLSGKLTGFLVGSRAIEIANFSKLFDGQFNDHAVHAYITKREVQYLSLFDDDANQWDRLNVNRQKVQILERGDRAFKLKVGERVGWSRSFADIELTEFGRMFDGRYNRPSLAIAKEAA